MTRDATFGKVRRMKPGEEFQPLMDDIFREKVLRARQIPAGRRLMMGLELFDLVEAGTEVEITGQS